MKDTIDIPAESSDWTICLDTFFELIGLPADFHGEFSFEAIPVMRGDTLCLSVNGADHPLFEHPDCGAAIEFKGEIFPASFLLPDAFLEAIGYGG